MKSGRLVVKRHAPWFGPLLGAGVLCVSIAAGWGLYVLGQHKAGFNSVEASEETVVLRNTMAELERENTQLRDQVAFLDRSKQVDQQAYTNVDDTLKSLQAEILELREEVSFYRGIVSPVESSSGLRIERLNVRAVNNSERLFRYKLVLTQVLKNDGNNHGVAEIFFDGLQEGKSKRLALGAVATDRRDTLNFRFRYFQKFEGDVRLPEGFSPRSVVVVAKGGGKKDIERTFDWQAAVEAVGSADTEEKPVQD